MNNLKVPVTIITGFLGAGKTTLIRHLLENANGARIAVIINEFGDLGIDKELLSGCEVDGCGDENLLELANGCICCTVADDFLPAMNKLLGRAESPDHIIIETSGLALPKPLVKAFNWPEVKSRATVDGVVAVVDSCAVHERRFAHDPVAVQNAREIDDALDHEAPLEEVYEDQLSCADIVLLNKKDLVGRDNLSIVKSEVKNKSNSQVKILSIKNGKIDPKILLGIEAAAEKTIDLKKSHHNEEEEHDHDDFESFVLNLEQTNDIHGFETLIRGIVSDYNILRIKGFINVLGKDMRCVIQGVGHRIQIYYDRPWKVNEVRQTSLVFIGEVGMDRKSISNILSSQ